MMSDQLLGRWPSSCADFMEGQRDFQRSEFKVALLGKILGCSAEPIGWRPDAA